MFVRKYYAIVCALIVASLAFGQVVVDTTHPMYLETGWPMYSFFPLIAGFGYDAELSTAPYDSSTKIVFIFFPETPFTPLEIVYLQDWVAAGGVLVLAGDHYGYSLVNNNINNFIHSTPWELPITIEDDWLFDPRCSHPPWFAILPKQGGAEPLVTGLDSAYCFTASQLVVSSPARSLFFTNPYVESESRGAAPYRPVLAIVQWGDGAVVVTSDIGLVYVNSSIYWTYMSYSNPNFLHRLLDYACADSDAVQSPDEHTAKSRTINIFPNPFNSSCTIDAPVGAKIDILDVAGHFVKRITAPSYIWTPDMDVASNIYLVRLTMGNRTMLEKVAYIK